MASIRPMRWPRFFLRTLLAVLALASATGGTWAYCSRWIEERHHFLDQFTYTNGVSNGEPRAPFVLWLLGEEGIPWIVPNNFAELSDVEYAEKLFPEASIQDERLPSWLNSPERAKLQRIIRQINAGLPKAATK